MKFKILFFLWFMMVFINIFFLVHSVQSEFKKNKCFYCENNFKLNPTCLSWYRTQEETMDNEDTRNVNIEPLDEDKIEDVRQISGANEEGQSINLNTIHTPSLEEYVIEVDESARNR